MPSERLLLDELPEWIEQQHLARYQFASRFVKELNVLDLACGSGYGSDMLAAAGARHVLGIDLSEEAIIDATAKFQRPNLTYEVGDATRLTAADNSFDAVISFETVEHLPDDHAFIAEVHRVLKTGGRLIVSTPDLRPGCVKPRLTGKPANPFHVREYTRKTLTLLLSERFKIVDMYGQNFVSGFFCILPIAAAVKAACVCLRNVGGAKLSHSLYYGGTGPAVQPAVSRGWAIPNYWVVCCEKM